MPLNKAGTRAQLIAPKPKAAGWTDSLISLEQDLDYTRRKGVGHVPGWARLSDLSVEPEERRVFLDDLQPRLCAA